jgi:hypothetical protein
MNYDQLELDASYIQTYYEPPIGQVAEPIASDSDAVRARIGQPKRVAYGPKPIEGLDIYRTDRSNAPIFIYIHGGNWYLGSAVASQPRCLLGLARTISPSTSIRRRMSAATLASWRGRCSALLRGSTKMLRALATTRVVCVSEGIARILKVVDAGIERAITEAWIRRTPTPRA